MYQTKLRKVGGSVMLAIPKPILEALGMSTNEPVGLTVNDGRLVVEGQHRRKYKLAELLAQCDLTANATEEDREWLDGPPAGRELI
jgi:antitoxin ChpS